MNNKNPWWLATQMGHENTEMIFKHYGKFTLFFGNTSGQKSAEKLSAREVHEKNTTINYQIYNNKIFKH